jgi:hypothetical protein
MPTRLQERCSPMRTKRNSGSGLAIEAFKTWIYAIAFAEVTALAVKAIAL